MDLAHATHIADSIIAKLSPFCERAMKCGSIRRRKQEVSDIDIVVIPKRDQVRDMFQNPTGWVVIPEFVAVVNQWTKVKGEPYGKMTSRLFEGHKVELYMADEDNFGAITLIRTGDSDFTHMIMKRVNQCGLEQRDGYLWKSGQKISTPTEQDYFRIINLPYVEPQNRDANAFKRLSSR